MAVIETKFSVGDTVWHANITTEARRHPCPDCLGSRRWEAKSPAGGVFAVDCPRCSVSYHGNDDLRLDYSVWTPTARRLTIGSVRAASGGDQKHQYMCLETGVGSGRLYSEDDLFHTEAEALACASAKAAANNADASGWVAKQFNKSARFCDYQLKDAAMEAAVDGVRSSLYRVRYLLEALESAESLEEVNDRIERWRQDPPEAPAVAKAHGV